MTGDQREYVKVRFTLEQDADGWPPAGSEGLWAVDLGDRLVRIDNNPWFARDIAAGDIVRVEADEHGELWSVEKIEWSGNCAIRVVPFEDGVLAGSRQAVIDLFTPMGVDGEGIEQFGMVSLNVPPDADLAAVKGLLARGEREGWWDFEEGCVGDNWIEAVPD
ncbi:MULTISPECIES: DUF4265 domain-containing protein [unclassified Nonomuraea]|uniref:DUF4265 domain-containing protein n=1 Tax=unclassified Nonomuraea TaxID=2593643 RepID=UPI0033CBF262